MYPDINKRGKNDGKVVEVEIEDVAIFMVDISVLS